MQSTLMEAASCALADADSAYLSTAPSRKLEGILTWMVAAARGRSDMDYAFFSSTAFSLPTPPPFWAGHQCTGVSKFR